MPSIEAIWRKHAGALSIVEIAGDHWTMFSTPNAESAAESLTRCLVAHSQEALPSVAASQP
jgi:thioesterase domain-containing protein